METPEKVNPPFESRISLLTSLPDPNPDNPLKEFIEELPVAVYICDAEGKITFYNAAAVALWGREPELGKDLWCGSRKIFSAEGLPMELDECPMAITLKEGRPVRDVEQIIERPDGSRVRVLPHPKPFFDSPGHILGAINILVEIPERSNPDADERTLHLKASKDLYHKMVEEVQDYAIILLDVNGNILEWNKGAEKIKGYTEEEILGKNFRVFYLEEDRQSHLPENLIREAVEKGKAMHEGWRLRKNGTRFWGSIVITALHDNQQNIIGFSKVTRDLTEKKLADDQLKQYTRDIEFQNRQLEEYAYVASHDLQEPLRKIQTFSELLEKNLGDKAEVKKYLDKINSASARMANLIKDVLQHAQISTGPELFVPTDLNEVLNNVIEDFEVVIKQKGCIITTSGLPVVRGIPIQLYQLFSNLLSNALKFTRDIPSIEVFSQVLSREEVKDHPELNPDQEYFQILFRDHGFGFEPQHGDQVFKLFNRLNHDIPGTGIGLAMCKRIVENHRGTIGVLSQVNQGTTFSVLLPKT